MWNGPEPQQSDRMIDAFAQAAAAGSVLELKYRMLAEMRPGLRPIARANKLQDVETAIVEEYRAELTAEDVALLAATRVLRNKIVHCDLDVAHEKLRDMGTHLVDGIVTMIDRGTGKAVPLSMGEKGFIFGWVLQGANNGFFVHAALKFNTAIDVVNRLLALG